MDKRSGRRVIRQKGFTLIELIIVIVVIGILSAVAIPKLTNVADAAHKAVNYGVLGMVRSAWSAAYAVNKTVPTAAQIAAQTSEPLCTGTGTTITCPVSWVSSTGAAGNLSINYDGATATGLTCATSADCQ